MARATHRKKPPPASRKKPPVHSERFGANAGQPLLSEPAAAAFLVLLCAAVAISARFGYQFVGISLAAITGLWIAYARAQLRTTTVIPRSPVSAPWRVLMAAAVAGAAVVLVLVRSGLTDRNIAVGLLLGAGAAGAAFYDPIMARFARRRRALLAAALVLASIVFAYALIGESLQAKWGPIDDHEIMMFLGPDGKARLSDLPSLLMRTEVGSPGGADRPRFRPSYYAVRILETVAWGNRPGWWYGSHMLMLAASLALYVRFFARWLGGVAAIALVAFLMTYTFWSGIWCRMGPGEIYCVLATAMYLEGFAGVLRASRRTRVRGACGSVGDGDAGAPPAAPAAPGRPRRTGARGLSWWILLTAGAMLAMGSKENFLLMVPPVWVLAIVALRRRSLGTAGIASVLLLTAYGALVAVAVGISMARAGGDVYHREVTAAGRFPLAVHGLADAFVPVAWWDVLIGLSIIAGTIALGLRRHRRASARAVGIGALIAAGLAVLYASQVVFYNGEFPAKPGVARYNFPGLLTQPLMIVTAVWFGARLLRADAVGSRLTRALRAGLVGGLLLLTFERGYEPIREATTNNVKFTSEWTAAFEAVATRLRSEPSRPAVLDSHNVWDYELVYSIQRFLTARGVTNPLFLRTERYSTSDDLTENLAGKLYDTSSAGGRGFQPLGLLPRDRPPFGVGLSGPPSSEYEGLGRLW